MEKERAVAALETSPAAEKRGTPFASAQNNAQGGETARRDRKPVVYTEWSRVTVNELAKIFHLQKAEVYQIIKDQVVLGMMVGTRRKYKIADFDSALNAKTRNDNAVLLELIHKQQSVAV